MMAIKDAQTIMKELASIYGRTGVPDMVPGTFEWDLFVYGPTYGAIYPIWQYLRDLDVFLSNDYNAFPPDVIRQILESAGIVPSYGTKATGYVMFYTKTAPANPISIPQGTIVSVDYDSSLQYRTVESFYIEPNYVDSYYDSTADLYKFPVAVESISPGYRYNVPPDTINIVVSSLVGIDGVMNESSITGGSDPFVPENSFDTFAAMFMSRHPLSESVLREQLLNKFPEVGTLVFLRPGDPDNISDVYANTIEIYVAHGYPAFTTDTIYVSSDELVELSMGPFLEVVSVSSTSGYVLPCSDNSTDLCYEVFPPTDPVAVGTTNAKAKIRFKNVTDPIQVEVYYSYDALVNDIQSYLDNIDMFPNVSFVVRRAPAANVNISCKVRLYPGASISEVTSRVYESLFRYFAELSMGSYVTFSDLFGFILNDEGIDDAYIGTFKVSVDGPADVNEESIIAHRNAVLTLGTLNLEE